MNDLHELVRVLKPDVPPLDARHEERQRIRLMSAIGSEATLNQSTLASTGGKRQGVNATSRPHDRRRRTLLAGVVVGSVAIVLVVTLVVVQGGPLRPTTAAAAVLEQAAAAAGQQSPSPGQFLYTETQSTYQLTDYKASTAAGELDRVATATFGETDQSWTDSTGQGDVLRTYGSDVFSSPADEAAWAASTAAKGQEPFLGGQSEPEAPALNVSGLPADASALASVLANGQMGTDQYIAAGPAAVFERAARLLLGPTSGMTPALASALFQVMADQRGARALGTVTDHDGQQGLGVAIGDAATTEVAEVIVDPAQGRLLEAEFVAPGPTSTLPGGSSCVGVSGGACLPIAPVGEEIMAPVWTDLVASGVVGSESEIVPASGTATITATQVPGAPIGLNATVDNGAVYLSWTAPLNQGMSSVIDYVVYAGTPGSPGNGGLKNTQSTATSYDWLYSPGGQPLSFSVQAVNAEGGGLLSKPLIVVP